MKKKINLIFLIPCFVIFSCVSTETIISIEPSPKMFSWDNASIYFLLTDRFYNGDVSNDFQHSDINPPAAYRGFMGGDIKGITQKIKEGYFTDLGIDAIWMTPLIEQIKGSVDEGTGNSFPFHGYWARDWTAIDERFGNEDDLKEMVDIAHAAGIRVIFDVVANHIGPVTDQDEVWPDDWVKTSPQCDYKDFKGTTDCTLVANLPDVRTESNKEVELPPYLVEKWKNEGRYEREVAELDAWFAETGYPRTAVNHILKWLVDFIKDYGIDGFRVDTVKHTEPYVWANLWQAAKKAFEHWKNNNSDAKIDDQPFYMVGEVYNYYVSGGRDFDFGDKKIDFFSDGFHALINFDFKTDAQNGYEEIFNKYNSLLQNDMKGKSVVNYISSHDDSGPYDLNRENPLSAGTKLMLCPGAVQIYYGDETARSLTVEAKGDATLRSFMNWDQIKNNDQINGYTTAEILTHWQKLGKFRNQHPSVGAGVHENISNSPYVFTRKWSKDKYVDEVVVGLDISENEIEIDVSSVFENKTKLYDYYGDQLYIVTEGKVSVKHTNGIVLLGRLKR